MPIADCPAEEEFDEILDPFGTVFRLGENRTRFLLREVGTGLPPIDYITQAGPFQHGASVVDFFARPRIITQRYRWPARHRGDWWALRTAMVDAVRPNRQLSGAARAAALTLRKYPPDGSRWDLRVMPDRSPNFGQREGFGWDEWALDEVLRFIAHDPIYFDPDLTVVRSSAAEDQLEFGGAALGVVGGVDFEPGERIWFGGGRQVAFTYAGTWLSWPTIEINGPVTNPHVALDAPGAGLSLAYTVAVGEIVTIETEPGKRSVSSPIGGNLIPVVGEGSALTSMFIAPAPLAVAGVNTIRLSGADMNDDSGLTVRYHTRKAGLGL